MFRGFRVLRIECVVRVCVCGGLCVCVFFFKQKTAYELDVCDWRSDVCSSDLLGLGLEGLGSGS